MHAVVVEHRSMELRVMSSYQYLKYDERLVAALTGLVLHLNKCELLSQTLVTGTRHLAANLKKIMRSSFFLLYEQIASRGRHPAYRVFNR